MTYFDIKAFILFAFSSEMLSIA